MESPVFCRECGALATLSWKLVRPRYTRIQHPTLPLEFWSAEAEEIEVGWCQEHWRPLPEKVWEIISVLEERGVALLSFAQ